MVEAPRIRIITEQIQNIKNKYIKNAVGTSYKKMNRDLIGFIIRKIWFAGKYIYLLVEQHETSYVIRTHLMMYGRIIVAKEILPRYFMAFELADHINDTDDLSNETPKLYVSWYFSQIKLLDPTCGTDEIVSNYDTCSSQKSIMDSFILMKRDISHPDFDPVILKKYIKQNLKSYLEMLVVDFLLDQNIFPGVGNILQQEALYRCKILPTHVVSDLNDTNIDCLIQELYLVTNQLYDHYKKNDGFSGNILQIYHKSVCPLDHKTVTKYTGLRNRRTTWCPYVKNKKLNLIIYFMKTCYQITYN